MEMEPSSATLLFLSLVTLVIFVSLARRKSSNQLRRPPSPWGLPFVGHLHHLRTSQPQIALRRLAKKYGPVMLLRLGQVDTVVVSSSAAAQEVLRENDLCFASRPSLVATKVICDNLDVAFAPYGAYWRMLRKLCVLELLSSRKVRQFAPVRDTATMSLVEEIRASGQGGKPVNLHKLLVRCASSITGKATFGERCDPDLRDQFFTAMEKVQASASGFCVGDLFPSLWFIDVATGMKRRLLRLRQQLEDVVDQIIIESEARRAEKKTTTTADEDLLTVMLRIRDEGGVDFPIGNENIKAIVLDLFTAGTETTSSSAELIMSELMRNPKMMAKAQAEVRGVLDNKSPQDHENHMDGLRYMRMVIKEAMRLHPAVPLLLPRVCRETCDVGGFEVKKGTRVIINSWALSRSNENWPEAEEFKPERFEDAPDGYDKGTQFENLPFGAGRRMCPGDVFALAVLELMVARLLYYFNWSLPNGMRPDQLDMDLTVDATARRANQLCLVASPYNIPMEN
ncbi:hypothetical protein ACQ4PT_000384 [Festuca glaucescens]